VLFHSLWKASAKALMGKQNFLAVEALQDTGRREQCHSKFLDFDTTLGYPSRFLSRL
jgi:hypothetical protein